MDQRRHHAADDHQCERPRVSLPKSCESAIAAGRQRQNPAISTARIFRAALDDGVQLAARPLRLFLYGTHEKQAEERD